MHGCAVGALKEMHAPAEAAATATDLGAPRESAEHSALKPRHRERREEEKKITVNNFLMLSLGEQSGRVEEKGQGEGGGGLQVDEDRDGSKS